MRSTILALCAASALAGCDLSSAQSQTAPAAVPGRYAAAGAWTPAAEVVPGSREETCPLYQNPALVRRGDAVLATWLARSGSDEGVFHWAELRPGATAWTAPRPIHGEARSYFQDGQAQLASLSDGTVVAFWLHPVNTSERRLMTAALPPGADTWTAPAPAPDPSSQHIRAAGGPDDVLHAAWSARGGPFYARRTPDGAWTAAEPMRDFLSRMVSVEMTGGPSPRQTSTSCGSPMIAAAPDGSVMVAWWDNQFTLSAIGDGERDLMWRVRAPDGRWSPSRRLETARSGEGQHSALGADAAGFVLLYAGEGRRPHMTRLAYRSDRWSAAQALGSGRMFEGALSPAGGGALLGHWREFQPRQDARFALAGSDGQGGFAALSSPPNRGFDLFAHAAAADGAGRSVALFDDPEEPQGCAGLAWSATTG